MNIQEQPKVAKETKKKIRVEFERTPLKERLKAKFLSLFFLKKVTWFIFRLTLLVGISYVVLFPFFSKIAGSLMHPDDLLDATVRIIPKHFTLDIYKYIILENGYFEALKNTFTLSLSTAIIQTFICCIIAYGLAKFKFRGNQAVFIAVIITMLIPREILNFSYSLNFTYFDVFGIFGLLSNIGILPDSWAHGINFMNSDWPLMILSFTGLAFKNGLYIFMLRQFFCGVPDELEESAYIDGSGVYRTFVQIILPLSIPMMVTVFMFAFCWQWTDDFYTTLFYGGKGNLLMPDIIQETPETLNLMIKDDNYAAVRGIYTASVKNTCGILIIAPLIVLYAFGQKFLVQGIERSGLTAD